MVEVADRSWADVGEGPQLVKGSRNRCGLGSPGEHLLGRETRLYVSRPG